MSTRLTSQSSFTGLSSPEQANKGLHAVMAHTQVLLDLRRSLTGAQGPQKALVEQSVRKEGDSLLAAVKAHFPKPVDYTPALAQSLRTLFATEVRGETVASHLPQAAYQALLAVVQHVEEKTLGNLTRDIAHAGQDGARLRPLLATLVALKQATLNVAVRTDALRMERQVEHTLFVAAQRNDALGAGRPAAAGRGAQAMHAAPAPARGRAPDPRLARLRAQSQTSPRTLWPPANVSSTSSGFSSSSSSSTSSSDSDKSFGNSPQPVRLKSPPVRGRGVVRNLPAVGLMARGRQAPVINTYVYQPTMRGINFQAAAGVSARPAGGAVEVTAGQKAKFLPQAYRHLALSQLKFSHLTDFATNSRFTMTSTVASGSFGKVRYAVGEDDTLLAVKEMRTVYKYGVAARTRQEKTYPVPVAKIFQEAQITQSMRDTIEAKMVVFDEAAQGMAAPFAGIRKKATPYKTHALIEVREMTPSNTETSKVHLVMTAELGDMRSVRGSASLTDGVRHQLAVSVAAQGFAELVAMHEHGKMSHMDLKLENMFYNGDGQIKLMDFGFAVPNDLDGGVRYRGHVGTLMAPEMYATNPDSDVAMRLSSKADVWTLAAAVVEMAAPRSLRTPFVGQHGSTPQERIRTRALNKAKMAEFSSWRESLRPTPGAPIDLERIDSLEGIWAAFFAPLAQNQPALCALLLERAFEADPTKRATAFEIAEQVVKLVPKAETPASNQILGVFREAEATRNNGKLIENAKTYNAWAATQTAK